METEYSKNSTNGLNTWLKNTTDPSKTDEVLARSKERQNEITIKILESSKRSVRLLRNSEEIALATSRELHCQSEQLVKTQKSLDALDSSLKNNHQLINKIKSPFGFLKNFVKSKQESLLSWKSKKQVESKHKNASKLSSNSASTEDYGFSQSSNLTFGNKANNQEKLHEKSSSSIGLEKLLDDDLNEISSSIARLKNLALEMGDEVDMQNENLDHIINKSEKVSGVLQKQNKIVTQMIG